MPLRVYCPKCDAPRTAPAPGARVRCRNCGRVFRAGTRVERRPARDEDDEDDEDDAPNESPGSQKLLFVLGGVALVLIGLTIGGGLAAWYFINQLPDPPDDEVVGPDDPPFAPPPPAVGPPPVNPGPVPPPDAN